jgi:hypothetical protein
MAVSALICGACAGTGERGDASDDEAAGSAEVDMEVVHADAGAKVVKTGRTRVHDPNRRGGYIVHNLNMTVTASDPAAALERARRQLEKLGGTVNNVNANDSNGSLNAVVPVSALPNVRGALASVGTRVSDENFSQSDQTPNFNETHRRLDRIELARAEVLGALKRASDPDAADGLGLLLELTAQERRNLVAQLNSFREQADGAHVYLSVGVDPAPRDK